MNNEIRNIDLEKILFFDIETVSRNKELNKNSREFDLYSWVIRDKTTGFVPPAKEVLAHYKKMAALKPEFNKIVCISIGFIKGTTLYYKALVGEQKEIIKQFYDIVNSTGFKICGHNIIGFDSPVIRLKAFEENIDFNLIPERINDVGKKPWLITNELLDTMVMLKGTYFYSMSLDAACMLSNIESSKDDISGPMVTQVYYEEGVERIAKYCNKDVIATAKLFCAIQGKRDYLTDFVDRDSEDLTEKKEVPLIKHILDTGNITTNQIELVKLYVEANDLDPNEVITLITAGISKTVDKLNDYKPLQDLKDALLGKINPEGIECIIEAKTLGKKHCTTIIKESADRTPEEKKDIVERIEKFLHSQGKSEQVRVKNALSFLKEQLEVE